MWNRLDNLQKNLWFIDEVEARWQRLLSWHTKLTHITVHWCWCNGSQFMAAWDEVATFIGDGSIYPMKECAHHIHGAEDLSDESLNSADHEYVSLLQYTSADLQLFQNVRTIVDAIVTGSGHGNGGEQKCKRSFLPPRGLVYLQNKVPQIRRVFRGVLFRSVSRDPGAGSGLWYRAIFPFSFLLFEYEFTRALCP